MRASASSASAASFSVGSGAPPPAVISNRNDAYDSRPAADERDELFGNGLVVMLQRGAALLALRIEELGFGLHDGAVALLDLDARLIGHTFRGILHRDARRVHALLEGFDVSDRKLVGGIPRPHQCRVRIPCVGEQESFGQRFGLHLIERRERQRAQLRAH